MELHLARAGVWKLDTPLYAVNYWMLGSGFVKTRTLEELAAIHTREIVDAQPTGPYRIAGFSFGGIVAVEIARQLEARGAVVELLFLLDPTEPNHTTLDGFPVRSDLLEGQRRISRGSLGRLHRRISHRATQAIRNPGRALSYLAECVRPTRPKNWRVRPWIDYRLVDLHGRRPNTLTTRLLPLDRGAAFWYVARRLTKDYVAAPCTSPVHAVFTDNKARQVTWRPLLGPEAQVTYIDGTHRGLVLEPALSQWIDVLGERLAAGQ